jgi:small conductance mechanosensitive channel
MAASPATEPSFLDTAMRAASGDQEMLRQLLGAAGAFSMRVLVAAVILAFTLWAAGRLARLTAGGVDRLTRRHHSADKTLSDFASAMIRYIVIAIGAVAVLQQLGVQATSVLAVLGAASLAIGLALQGTLSNVAAGVMVLLLRPYRVGDRVELNGKAGVVTHLDLFNTRLLDYDGLTVHLPNGKVFGETIVNLTQSGRRRIELTVGIDYEDDIDVATALMLRLAAADERILPKPAPWANVTGLGDSAVNVTLRCWVAPDGWNNAKFDLLRRIKDTFEAEGLSFPYPHQVTVDRPLRPVRADEGTEVTDGPRRGTAPR